MLTARSRPWLGKALFSASILLAFCGPAAPPAAAEAEGTAPPATAVTVKAQRTADEATVNISTSGKQQTTGTFRVYSRTKDTGDDKSKRDTVVFWNDAAVQPHEEFDTVVVGWGRMDFYGKARDLVVVGGEVVLHDGAQIEESLVVLGGKLKKREGAKVGEQVLFELPEEFPAWIAWVGPIARLFYSDGAAFLSIVVRAVLIMVLGALMLALFPNTMQEAQVLARREPLRCLLWSVGGLILYLPGMFLLFISIIGVFFVPLHAFLYVFVYAFCAFVLLGEIVGAYLPPRDSVVMPPLRYCYGVFVIIVVSYIPFVGPPLIMLAMLVTSGAVLRVFKDRLQSRSVAKRVRHKGN